MLTDNFGADAGEKISDPSVMCVLYEGRSVGGDRFLGLGGLMLGGQEERRFLIMGE